MRKARDWKAKITENKKEGLSELMKNLAGPAVTNAEGAYVLQSASDRPRRKADGPN